MDRIEVDSELGAPVILPNQKHVWIRPLRPGEEQAVRALLTSLGPTSWYLRFLSPAPHTHDALARSLASVDGRRRLTLVAEHRTTTATEIVAMANLAAVDHERAEVGLVVRDDWQCQSLGTELAIRAMEAGEQRGFRQFIGHLLSHNVGVRRLLTRIAIVVSTRFSGGVSEYLFVRRR